MRDADDGRRAAMARNAPLAVQMAACDGPVPRIDDAAWQADRCTAVGGAAQDPYPSPRGPTQAVAGVCCVLAEPALPSVICGITHPPVSGGARRPSPWRVMTPMEGRTDDGVTAISAAPHIAHRHLRHHEEPSTWLRSQEAAGARRWRLLRAASWGSRQVLSRMRCALASGGQGSATRPRPEMSQPFERY